VQLPVRATDLGGTTCVCFRPISVRISPTPDSCPHAATVISVSYLGDLMQYELRSGEHSICARSLPHPGLVEGARVYWSVSPDACFLVAA
jgi:hypothetical protein